MQTSERKMTKPDALERLRDLMEIGEEDFLIRSRTTIIACAEVVEDRLMKERGVRITKVLRQLYHYLRSVVEDKDAAK